MKANELRIGNWVTVYPQISIQQVVDVMCDGINTDKTIRAHYGLVEPIPLTEEWLLKFGFEIKLDNFNWNAAIGVNEIGDFKLSLRHTDDFGWFYKSRCTPIKYVHQLQNLYFALTGEELTIKE
jgi:hypothetical protein